MLMYYSPVVSQPVYGKHMHTAVALIIRDIDRKWRKAEANTIFIEY